MYVAIEASVCGCPDNVSVSSIFASNIFYVVGLFVTILIAIK